jgi:DNA-binding GntR family transcriptional regulator
MSKTPVDPPARAKKGAKRAMPAIPLAEQAYVGLKHKILARELSPGDHVNVAQLSEQLGLGRNPILQAIHRLDREGLVDIIPRKGILVKAETLDSFLELIAARQLVEPYLTGLAVEQATPELLASLKRLLEAGWEHHRKQNRLGSMEVDRRFHQTLYASAGNDLLADFAAQLLDRSMRLWFRPVAADPGQPNIAELESLYETIERGDKQAAMEFMSRHIGSVQNKFLA